MERWEFAKVDERRSKEDCPFVIGLNSYLRKGRRA
jgi:hypothetical protein